MDFRDATDELFAKVDHEDLAKALGVSVASIRQARLKPEANARRAPPGKWREAVIRLAEERLNRYRTLIARLSTDRSQGADIRGIKEHAPPSC